MPEPAGRGQRYMPGLDGLRALAVGAVIAYHLNLSWAPGGLLGVGVFFTLRGYLITDLLLVSWETTGTLRLANFWVRRARRLLPALFTMLAVVSVWVAVAQPSQLGALRGDVAAAAVYVSNWWLALQHVSYFARFGPPSPLGHLWSLAIEEQFYLVWPWLLWLGLLWLARRRAKRESLAALRAVAAEVPAALVGAGAGGEPSGQWPATTTTATPAADLRSLGYLLSGRAALGMEAAERQPSRARVGMHANRLQLWPLAVASLVLAIASAAEMAVLYHPSFDPSRIYDGTDTRAFGLLFGAALAMVWPSTGMNPKLSRGARWLLDGLGAAGLAAFVLLVWRTNEYSAFLYRGGLVLLSLATVVVVAVAAHPGGRLGKLLGMQPLRWAGVRSYAIYLWHYPVIVLTAPSAAAGTDLPRAAVQVAATLVLAELSWRLVESPIRRGALGRLWAQVRAGAASKRTVGPRSWAALGVVPLALVLAALGLAGELPVAPHSELASNSVGISAPAVTTTSLPPASSTTVPGPPPTSAPAGTAPSTTSPSEPTSRRTTTSQPTTTSRPTTSRPHRTTTTAAPVTTHPSTSSPSTSTPGSTSEPTTTTTLPQAPLRTSCQAVVHLGDSTSESLVSSSYLPDPSQRLQAEYARVGVARSVMEIYGGNSIVETLPGEQNAYQLAKSLVDAGYRGCWVVALGTNDAADVYVGSNVGMAQRIDRMMSLIGNQPVLWVNVKTLLAAGPYSEANMQRWDDALVAACSSHPDMRVFNWAGVVQPSWYTSDGIHFNSPGSAPRAAAIADALATAFPAGAGTGAKRSGSCVVDGSPSWHLPAFKM